MIKKLPNDWETNLENILIVKVGEGVEKAKLPYLGEEIYRKMAKEAIRVLDNIRLDVPPEKW